MLGKLQGTSKVPSSRWLLQGEAGLTPATVVPPEGKLGLGLTHLPLWGYFLISICKPFISKTALLMGLFKVKSRILD